MFESVNPPRVSRRKQIVTAIGSTLVHATIVGLGLAVPLLYFAEPLPTASEHAGVCRGEPTAATTAAAATCRRAAEGAAGEAEGRRPRRIR